MKLLGAILAGGQSRRFGSDKAHAVVEGMRLIDKVASALKAQCDAVIVCGREEAGFTCVSDRPTAGLGPLGGLNAALHHAALQGFDAVLSSGCDVPDLPPDLAVQLDKGSAGYVENQPVIGLWPVTLLPQIERFLAVDKRALYGFAEEVQARAVRITPPLGNINTPSDLSPHAQTQ